MTPIEYLTAVGAGEHGISNLPCDTDKIATIRKAFDAAALDYPNSDHVIRTFKMAIRKYYLTLNGFPNTCSEYVNGVNKVVFEMTREEV